MADLTIDDVLTLIRQGFKESGEEFIRHLKEMDERFARQDERFVRQDERFARQLEESRKAQEESRKADEESRKAAEEELRKRLEESRKAAEESRKAAEESRKADEESRKAAEEELRKGLEESRKAAEESRKGLAEELQKGLEKSRAEFDRDMKEVNKQLGHLGNTFGDWAESYFSKRTKDKFREMGYAFNKSGSIEFEDSEGNCFAEVDLWMENAEYAMALEVKSELRKEHIDEHIERINRIREYMDTRGDKRKILGAVAGMTFKGNCERYAVRNGLYAVTQSGENVVVLETPSGWKPKEF